MALSVDVDDMLAAVREVRAELEAVKVARRRLPPDDYLGRALLVVEQQKLESRLTEVRRAARGI
ncbi:MAG: hypothetical protein OEM97_00090 [Acidimicrobiia bacterium]|nr:hypothetical protein [Acidimicrobiia bacterium]